MGHCCCIGLCSQCRRITIIRRSEGSGSGRYRRTNFAPVCSGCGLGCFSVTRTGLAVTAAGAGATTGSAGARPGASAAWSAGPRGTPRVMGAPTTAAACSTWAAVVAASVSTASVREEPSGNPEASSVEVPGAGARRSCHPGGASLRNVTTRSSPAQASKTRSVRLRDRLGCRQRAHRQLVHGRRVWIATGPPPAGAGGRQHGVVCGPGLGSSQLTPGPIYPRGVGALPLVLPSSVRVEPVLEQAVVLARLVLRRIGPESQNAVRVSVILEQHLLKIEADGFEGGGFVLTGDTSGSGDMVGRSASDSKQLPDAFRQRPPRQRRAPCWRPMQPEREFEGFSGGCGHPLPSRGVFEAP